MLIPNRFQNLFNLIDSSSSNEDDYKHQSFKDTTIPKILAATPSTNIPDETFDFFQTYGGFITEGILNSKTSRIKEKVDYILQNLTTLPGQTKNAVAFTLLASYNAKKDEIEKIITDDPDTFEDCDFTKLDANSTRGLYADDDQMRPLGSLYRLYFFSFVCILYAKQLDISLFVIDDT